MNKIITLLLFLSIFIYADVKFLEPQEAFKPNVILNTNSIEATIELADDIYIYEDSIKLELKSQDVTIKDIKYPQISILHDDKVYQGSPKFIVNLNNSSNFSGTKEVEFLLSYQGCSSQGLCYEPETKSFKLKIDGSQLSNDAKTITQNRQEDLLSQTDEIASKMKNSSILVTLFTFLGFGLLLALTPCTFPMIPIISGIIISQGEGLTTKKAFLLSLVYVLAMSIAYTIAGVLAGLFGSNLQTSLQNPFVIYTFSAIFVALALSMFGVYELKLPDSFVSKVSSNNTKKGGYIGVAIMGFLSALIVGPCVAAPLAGALIYIGQSGDAILGGAALFFMSIGMGLPLIVVGVSAGKFMPRPGRWMSMVSVTFGLIMLGVAIWMLSRVVDEYVTILLLALLLSATSIYFGVFEKTTHIVAKVFSMALFIYSVSLFIGAFGGSTNLLKPLEFLKPTNIAIQKNTELEFTKVTSTQELDAILSKNKGKKILLDFSASWCVACKELDEKTFSNETIKSKLSEYLLIRADLSQNTQKQKELSKKYGVFGPPVIIFIDESGNIDKSKTVVGFIEPKELLPKL